MWTAEPVRLAATDGYPLAASWYGPPEPEIAVVVAPATGVKQRLYEPFARFLAGHGIGALTWDWRGTGESRPAQMRGFQATMRDWAERDLAAAIAWAASRSPDGRLYAVGHSFGGQAIGLAPNARRIAGLVTVAAQSGYWAHWPRPQRYAYAMLWYAGMPLLTRLVGYFPSKRIGAGEDLPKGVALQWAGWCRSPDYLDDYAGHRFFDAPILALSFTDDRFAPRAAVENLHVHYGSPDCLHRHVAPRAVGADRIGHFGFFREGRTPGLWNEVVAWIRDRDRSRAAASPPDAP